LSLGLDIWALRVKLSILCIWNRCFKNNKNNLLAILWTCLIGAFNSVIIIWLWNNFYTLSTGLLWLEQRCRKSQFNYCKELHLFAHTTGTIVHACIHTHNNGILSFGVSWLIKNNDMSAFIRFKRVILPAPTPFSLIHKQKTRKSSHLRKFV
jgi:hypothetical protein